MQNGCSTDRFPLIQSITATLFQTLIVLLLEIIVSFQAIFHVKLTLLQHTWMPSLLTDINLSIIFSLPLIDWYDITENQSGPDNSIVCIPQMALSGLVASDEENDDNPTDDNTSIKRQLDVTKQTHRATSIIPKDGFICQLSGDCIKMESEQHNY